MEASTCLPSAVEPCGLPGRAQLCTTGFIRLSRTTRSYFKLGGKREGDDIHAVDSFVTGSLVEERMALRDAEIELLEAGIKIVVYGPDVATEKDYHPVAEFNVCGSRVLSPEYTFHARVKTLLSRWFCQGTLGRLLRK